MKYPLVIFDFDGTLANSLPCFLGIMRQLSDQNGFRKVEDHEVEQLRAFDVRQLMKFLEIPFWKLPGITRQFRQMMADQTDQVSLFPGIQQFLEQLTAADVKLAIVSSNAKDNVQKILGPDLVALFSWMECEASIFGKRPKLRKVLRKSGLTSAQAIYIGDEIRDLQAAHAERLAFGAVTWGHTLREFFLPHGPQEVFETVELMSETLLSKEACSLKPASTTLEMDPSPDKPNRPDDAESTEL